MSISLNNFGPYSKLRTANWPIAWRKQTQPYNKKSYLPSKKISRTIRRDSSPIYMYVITSRLIVVKLIGGTCTCKKFLPTKGQLIVIDQINKMAPGLKSIMLFIIISALLHLFLKYLWGVRQANFQTYM